MSFVKLPEKSPIYDLQTMLRTILPGRLLNPDGIYGNETKSAVTEFQRIYALPVTGITDLATWERLHEEYQKKLIHQEKAETLQIVLQPDQVIKIEEENLHLYLIQAILIALGELYLELPKVRVTGKNDPQTQSAIRWIQGKAALKQTGELDKTTWQHLTHQYRSAVGDGTGYFPYRVTQRKITAPERTPLSSAAP